MKENKTITFPTFHLHPLNKDTRLQLGVWMGHFIIIICNRAGCLQIYQAWGCRVWYQGVVEDLAICFCPVNLIRVKHPTQGLLSPRTFTVVPCRVKAAEWLNPQDKPCRTLPVQSSATVFKTVRHHRGGEQAHTRPCCLWCTPRWSFPTLPCFMKSVQIKLALTRLTAGMGEQQIPFKPESSLG